MRARELNVWSSHWTVPYPGLISVMVETRTDERCLRPQQTYVPGCKRGRKRCSCVDVEDNYLASGQATARADYGRLSQQGHGSADKQVSGPDSPPPTQQFTRESSSRMLFLFSTSAVSQRSPRLQTDGEGLDEQTGHDVT